MVVRVTGMRAIVRVRRIRSFALNTVDVRERIRHSAGVARLLGYESSASSWIVVMLRPDYSPAPRLFLSPSRSTRRPS